MVEVGAQVRFGAARWQVVALSRQGDNLLGENGADQVVLAGHLFADPGFAVLGAEQPVEAVPQWGLFETAPVAVREKVPAWLRHITIRQGCGCVAGTAPRSRTRPRRRPRT
ncbi:hypothetical protein [Streptomyces sp. NPDC057966]|uniref:hypothetical protein n=1 Tax=Streptomyces sp. NPDC057966 TaxID=3346292 RepID=UPI0036E9C1CC